MSAKRFSFTLLSKNASANHLESHSCKNKGLKVPCFHTLTKNIGGQGAMRRLRVPIPSGRGVRLGDSVIPLARRHEGSEPAILASDEGSQCSAGREPQSVNRESPVTNHEPLRLSPLTSTLTKTKDLKSFNINTYKKRGGLRAIGARQEQCLLPHQPPFLPLPPLPHPVSERLTDLSTVFHSAAQPRASNGSKIHFPAFQGDHRHGNRRTCF